MTKQRVFLIDGSLFLREALKRVFENSPGISVVGETTSLDDLMPMLRSHQPDWLIVSQQPKTFLSEEIIGLITTEFPQIRIMSVTTDGGAVRVRGKMNTEREYFGLTLDNLRDLIRS